MIINHVSNSPIDKTDTDKLPDIEAMILEKSEELRTLCFNASRQIIIIADARGAERGIGTGFWNLKINSDKFKDADIIRGNTEDGNKAFNIFLMMIHNFLQQFTNGDLGIVNKQSLLDSKAEIQNLKETLEKILEVEGSSLWDDDRDAAADEMISIAKKALGKEE